MKLYKLAWRNIWRNKRRAIITIASVFFSVFFCTIMLSITEGMWKKMIENTLRTQTGHIQIHGKDYWDDKITDNFMTMDKETIAGLEKTDNIDNVSPRVETFAMASFGTRSKGVAVIGISPEKEKEKSNLPVRIVRGNYLDENDDGILIGEGLAKYLNAEVGDTLAFIGQGYHGVSAAGLLPVRGILRMLTTEMDNGMIYMTLPSAQNFINMPDGYSGILISVIDERKLYETMRVICEKLRITDYELRGKDCIVEKMGLKAIYSWRFTMEKLLQTAETDKAFSKLTMYILYLIVGFGILGTVIMMTNERRREFAVMISLGMTRGKLKTVISLELLILALIGVMLALAVTVPVTFFFAANPIQITGDMAKMYEDMGMEAVIPMATDSIIFITQILTILVFSCLSLIYPATIIRKLKITDNK
jgi:ABC-type lipoprotein release transport system permease subunit